MKRLVIITVGKTHSGKTTFARELERKLDNSIVMDQDNHAEFINAFYKNLQPDTGPNTLKHAISQLIVDYAIKNTNRHLIICNSNRSRKGRTYLLEELFKKNEFTRILVHFEISDDVLMDRIKLSQANTNIFRGNYFNFEEVLIRQNAESFQEDVKDPIEAEADHLFVIRDSGAIDDVIHKILQFTK